MNNDDLIDLVSETISDTIDLGTTTRDYAIAVVDALQREGLLADCEPMEAGKSGWSDWVHPIPGYRMQCCDCGLVHDAEFKIVERSDDAPLNPGESDESVIVFRLRRHGEAPIRPKEIKPGMRYEFDKVDEEAVFTNRRALKGDEWTNADGKSA